MYFVFGKRFFDIFFAVTGLVALSPLFVSLLIALAITHRGRPVFRQPRPGLNGKVFMLFKFRTMQRDGVVTSPLCRWLRNCSLDEIPQLWNILKGDMSVVGPRPLLVDYLSIYTADQARRHHVRPGLTGWAQIHGFEFLDFERKLELDVWYVKNRTAMLDMRVICMTATLFWQRGNAGKMRAAKILEVSESI